MAMQLPRSFKLGKLDYSVLQVPHIRGEHKGRVRLYPSPNVITVATHRLGERRRLREVAQTFWHETVHAILHDMGEERLCFDERFVDDFAKRLNQIVHTAVL